MYAIIIAALVANTDGFVAGLSSDDFHTREKSFAALTLIGKSAKPALLRAANSGCPEARCQTNRLLDGLYQRRVNSFRPFPPIDGMWYCDKRFSYVHQWDSQGGECAEAHKKYGHYQHWASQQNLTSADGDYPTFRRATRRAVEEWMAEGRTDEWIRDKLADITRRDDLCRRKMAEAAELRRRMNQNLPASDAVPLPGVPMIMPGPMGIGIPWFPPVINAKDAELK